MASLPRDDNRITSLGATSNADGRTVLPVYVDSATNRLLVQATISGGGFSSASVGPTGSAVPTSADFIGLNVGGTLRGATGSNPTGSVYAIQNDMVAINGVTVSTGNGTSGTGVQRVTIASDSTFSPVIAAGANTIGSIASITTSVTPGTAAANLGKAEDAAHTSGDTGVMSLAVRNDAGTALATTDLDYIPLTTDNLNHLRTVMPGVVSTANSSTATLGIAGVFTGTSESIINFNEARISVFADQASATDGLSIQQSSNGTNWDITDTYTIAAGSGRTFAVPRQAQFFRVVYTNGGVAQGSFRLQVIFNRVGASVSSNRPSDGYTNETDLEQGQSFPMMFNGTTWDRNRGDTTNGLDVDVTRLVPGTTATSLGKAEDAAHASGDTGVATWGVRNDNLATTYGADQDYTPIAVDLKGATITVQKAATGAQTTVAGSATNVTLLAANSARRGASIYNDSTAILYVRAQATATTSNFTVKLFADDYWEAPAGYTGIIDGIWASASGNARITEYT